MSACIEEFREYLEIERNCTESTVRTYISAIRLFCSYLEESGLHLEDATAKSVRGWFAAMSERGNAASSRAARLTCLKSFYRWWAREGRGEDVAAGVESPRLREPEMFFLSAVESQHLMETVRELASETLRERDVAIVSVFLACGLRRSELIGINLSDIDLDEGTVRVTRKGQKVQVLPLNSAVCEAIRNYLAVRPDSESEALFLSRGTRMSRSTVWTTVKKYLEAAGFEGSPMTLRHSFATQLMRRGVHIRVIQQLMGHEYVTTTERYTHVAPGQMREATEALAL
ncbi:MAG: tyrosine-type recombinase/integrase [Armatimonadota bacterium]|jgi:site-specific recombinase XerD